MPLQVPQNAVVHDLPKIAVGKFLLADAPNSSLFAGPAKLEDISQGSIADCFFLSSLMAILSRPNGAAYIENMIVESAGRVTVRLYQRSGEALYIRTKKCRLQLASSRDNVSTRSCCWVDVIEACASVFNMKARDGADDIPMNLQQPNLENLSEGVDKKALAVLLGVEVNCKLINDTGVIDIYKNPGYGAISCLISETVAPDKPYRQDIIAQYFGDTAGQWNSWSAKNEKCFDQFLAATDKHPITGAGETLRPRVMKASLVEAFLKQKIPPEFHGSINNYLNESQVIAGNRIEPVYTEAEIAYYNEIEGLYRNNWPITLSSRKSVGRSRAQAPTGEEMCKGLLGGHVYCLQSVDHDDHGRHWILITNPWGRYVRNYDIVTGKPYQEDNIYSTVPGGFRITLHDLLKRFETYSWAECRF